MSTVTPVEEVVDAEVAAISGVFDLLRDLDTKTQFRVLWFVRRRLTDSLGETR